MNRLCNAKRAQILQMLCEGSSLRSISRVCDVSINTVTKLLVDAGNACAAFHDKQVRRVKAKRVQCDEIWSFCYAKSKNVRDAKAPVEGAGDGGRAGGPGPPEAGRSPVRSGVLRLASGLTQQQAVAIARDQRGTGTQTP